MSNSEELHMLNTTDMPADPVASRFVGLGQDLGIERDPVPEVIEIQEPVSTFKPKVPKPVSTSAVGVSGKENVKLDEALDTYKVEEKRILDNKIKDMEAAIKLLIAGRDGIKLKAAQAETKPLDWAKIQEKDVFDLDVPIEPIGEDLPDYMKVELKDSNFVARWVQKMSRRLGPMKAMGYVYVTADEIEGELNLAIEPDENGVFRHDDVILMKIEKRRYYGLLRKNHMRALAMTNPKSAHKTAQQRVISDMQTGNTTTLPDGTGVARENVRSGDFNEYAGKNKLSVYAPGFEL